MTNSVFNLSDLDGKNGFALNGINARDGSGSSVSGGGDVNGDGIDDLIVGAPGANPNGYASGQSYVVFGSTGVVPASLELSDLDGSNGFALNGIIPGDRSGVSVSEAGDVNGDGFDDLIIGAPDAPFALNPYSVNQSIGQSYVVFGSGGEFPASFELADLDGNNGFVLNGINKYDNSGVSVSRAGDINNDGFDDLIVGTNLTPPGDTPAGQSYVVFGSESGFPASLELADLDGTNGLALNGINEGDQSGRSVSGAGDINGDGIDDLIIGAYGADPNGVASGQSYVVFGSTEGFPASLELADLDGTNGFALNGINEGDQSGKSVSRAGDINGDGFDDLIIGALFASPNDINEAGQSYVVFGSEEGFPASLELADLDGTNGFALNGINPRDSSGLSVSGAGDVNGDGFDDLIIGAPRANSSSGGSFGQSYLVFGSESGFPASLDLANLDGSNGFALNGINPGDSSGGSVSGAGDVNGDGFDDLIFGAPSADPNGVASGQSYVVFGVPDLEIGLYDTDTDTLITPIKNDDVIPASILPNGNVTIAAFVTENSRFFGDIESIFLDLNQGVVTQTEDVEPYALFGDVPPGDFKAGSGIPLGDNSISFKLYSGDGLSGDFLGTVTRSFSIVKDLDIGLYDADSDELITPLNEGDELLASDLEGRNVTIAAFVPEDSIFFNQVESMSLNLNEGEVIRTENIEPYSLFGDINGNYSGGALPLGDNKIAFELYPENNLQDGLLDTVTRNFTIINDLYAPLIGSSQQNELFSIDVSTGEATLISFMSGIGSLATEIEFNTLTNTLYAEGTDGNTNLETIEPTTGASLGVVFHPFGALNGLEFVGSTLYGTFIPFSQGPSDLVIVDQFTGNLTPVGATGRGPISGLAWNPTDGILYGVTADFLGNTSDLVTIDPTTGQATVIGPTGFDRVGSIEFGPDGNLYGGISQNGSLPNRLIRIEPATGSSTIVGDTGFSITGLTLTVAPEPLTIHGTNQKDDLTGGAGNDSLNGGNGQDSLTGLAGNDSLNGGNGQDTLIGVAPNFAYPGLGEIDPLTGGNGPDTFVLGDANSVYYHDGVSVTQGLNDYALITDFSNEDLIQLKGSPGDYNLVENFPVGSQTGTGIFLKDTIDELLGLVEGVTGLTLNSNDFSFV